MYERHGRDQWERHALRIWQEECGEAIGFNKVIESPPGKTDALEGDSSKREGWRAPGHV